MNEADKNAETVRRGYEAFNSGVMKKLTEIFPESASRHTHGSAGADLGALAFSLFLIMTLSLVMSQVTWAADTWTATGSLITGRSQHTATLLFNGKVLVAGGVGGSGNNGAVASAEIYDPATGAWTATGSMTTPRYSHTATLLPNGKVLVAGGYNDHLIPTSRVLASAELYDPATGAWTATGSMTTAHYYHTATLLPNGQILVAGGFNLTSGYLASAELYDPATGAWTATGSLNTAHDFHTATLLPNGQILVAGGAGGNGGLHLTSAELYNPTTESWTATSSMATGRDDHTATLLPNGQVLVAGGAGSDPTSAELYDPATGAWTATGSMTTDHVYHTATLLPNGQVLVAGGGWELQRPDQDHRLALWVRFLINPHAQVMVTDGCFPVKGLFVVAPTV